MIIPINFLNAYLWFFVLFERFSNGLHIGIL